MQIAEKHEIQTNSSKQFLYLYMSILHKVVSKKSFSKFFDRKLISRKTTHPQS